MIYNQKTMQSEIMKIINFNFKQVGISIGSIMAMIVKAVSITKEQKDYVDSTCLNFSKFVQRAIQDEMKRGDTSQI